MDIENDFSLEDIFSQLDTDQEKQKSERIPFKFLDSYTKTDNDIFFGREEEINDVFRKFHVSKLLLIYGRSGTGKSSIINCGLLNRLPSEDIYPITIRCSKNPYEEFRQDIRKQRKKLILKHKSNDENYSFYIDENQEEHKPKTITDIELLNDIFELTSKPILLVFDQFEEIFILSNEEKRHFFVETIHKILSSKLKIHFVFIIREEYLANLTEFENTLPNLFHNRIRIERLHRAKAKQVIEEPCYVCNIDLEKEVSEKIIERLTDEKGTLELTYLQVILDYLYKKALADKKEKIIITNKHFDEIKSIGNVLTQFLDEQLANMKDGEKGEEVLKKLISTDGTKRRLNINEIIEELESTGSKIEKDTLNEILHYFVNVRIISDKDENGNYELKHDSIAARIFERMTTLEKELNEVKKFIENSFYYYKKRNKLLDEKDILYLMPYENKLFLKPELKEFISLSKKDLNKSKRKKQIILISLASITITILSVFLFIVINANIKQKKLYQDYLESEAQSKKALYEKYLSDGNSFLQKKQPEEAIKNYDIALTYVPLDTTFFSGKEALSGKIQANNLILSASEYYIIKNKADSLYKLGENYYFEAIKEYNIALKFNYDTVYPQTQIKEIENQINIKTKEYVDRAKVWIQTGDKDIMKKALIELQKANKLKPNNPEIINLIKQCQ